MWPQVEEWAHGVSYLSKIKMRPTKMAYTILGMLLELEYKYLQRKFPEVDNLMGKIEMDLREPLLSVLF